MKIARLSLCCTLLLEAVAVASAQGIPASHAAPHDAVAAPKDTLAAPHDSVAAPKDTLAASHTLPSGGRLIALPAMSERQIRELVEDVALQLGVMRGYERISGATPTTPAPAAAPSAVLVTTIAKRSGNGRRIVRLGFVTLPRRLPQLWLQAFAEGANVDAIDDIDDTAVHQALDAILGERGRVFGKMRLSELATEMIPLSYVDPDAALFALRAMGYSAITETESMPNDGERPAEAPTAAPSLSSMMSSSSFSQQSSQEDPHRPRFPAIKNLPSTISLDRLPLVVKMPSADARSLGLVGESPVAATRDQFGLTVLPNAAHPLADTVTGGTSDLLVIYHPAYPEQLARLKKVIDDTIDKPARQVYIECLVIEISSDALKDLGVQWDIQRGNQTWSIGTLVPLAAGGSAFSFTRGPNAVTQTQITARVAALVQADKAEILSRPSVITLDNRQATIRVGTDIPVATSVDAGAAGSGSNRVAFSFQYIPTGILLNVRPRVSDDLSEISMLIDATVSATVPGQDLQVLDPTTRLTLASAPTISTRRVQTYARIRDNQPLIIGGLLSRNQIKSSDRVPLLGNIPVIGALFGHTSVEDDRREVIIVLTPSVVTENIRETKAQYPKDDSRFDQLDTTLFKEQYRIRAEDLVDSSDFRFSAKLRALRAGANRAIDRDPALATQEPYSLFRDNRVPGEFFFVAGMMYRMLDRLNASEPIRIENLKFFERDGYGMRRPVSVSELLARHGDGVDPDSFFAKNPGKALALTFPLTRIAKAPVDSFAETLPEISYVDCHSRDEWRRILWDMNQPADGENRRHTILIYDHSDLRRLQLAYATQNTVLNNGGASGQIFDRWLVGRMLQLQEVSPNWERILNGQIAQYYFLGEHYYMYFAQEHQRALSAMEEALRTQNAPLASEVKRGS